jgi:hypothetical protein
MRDATRTVLAIVGGFVFLSGAVVYASIRIGNSIEKVGSPRRGTHEGAETMVATPTEPSSPMLNEHGIPVDRIMTYDFFTRHWRPTFADRAERACWLPLEQTKKFPALPSQIHFDVEVDADGSVVEVRPNHNEDMMPGIAELRTCVARIIQTMKFAAPGKRESGPVQADRPPKS